MPYFSLHSFYPTVDWSVRADDGELTMPPYSYVVLPNENWVAPTVRDKTVAYAIARFCAGQREN
jgi:hypothetical protein